MKILILSDTHGKLEKVREVLPKIKGLDMIVHLGDYEKDAVNLEKELGIETIHVKGNLDGAARDDYKILQLECGNVLLTHGNFFNVGYNYNKLLYACEEHNCKGAFFGHTHMALNEEFNGIRLINPGSISVPRDGSSGTYAIVRSNEDGFDCTIMYYNTNGVARPESAGRLRDILNNSDRF